MRKLLMVLSMLALIGPLCAAEKLGADGFPANWGDEDFHVGTEQPITVTVPSMTMPSVAAPKTFRIDQLQRVSLAPSGTTPVALPPIQTVTNTYMVSKTYYKPLAAAFDGSLPENKPVMTGIGVSSTANVSDSKGLTLDPGDVAGFGVLGPDQGGFGAMVWTSSSIVNGQLGGKFFAQVRVVGPLVGDPALREAWRRLLLTSADAPTLKAGRDGKVPNWLGMRAALLERLGMHEAAWSLWRVVPPGMRMQDDELAMGWVRSNLLAGNSKEACDLARSRTSARAGGWWAMAMASCAAIEATTGGNANALGLSLQLVPNEMGLQHPVLMFSLMAVRDGGQIPEDTMLRLSGWEGLVGAVVAAYPSIISVTDVPLLPDVALRRMRESATLPDEIRIPAARALAAQTGWVQDGLGLTKIVSTGVIAESTPDAAVVAWGQTHNGSQREVPLVVKSALRLGEIPTAQTWWPRWRGMEGQDLDDRKQMLQVQVAMEAAGGGVSDTTLARWLATQNLSTKAGATQAQRVLLAVEGLGTPVSDTIWDDYRGRAVKVSDGADAAWRRMIAKASKAQDVPQVLSLISEGFAGKQAGAVPPAVAGDSVAALVAVGLPDIAHRVVAEVVTGEPEVMAVDLGTSEVPGIRISASEAISATLRSEAASSTQPDMLPPPRAKVGKVKAKIKKKVVK